ncbi:TPA: hypothetical protein ACH3X2_003577 [Trebouxia sp. C0005]
MHLLSVSSEPHDSRRMFCRALNLLLIAQALAYRQDAFIGYSEKHSDKIVLHSLDGEIPISLLDAVAPKTCELVSELAQTGCTTCRFYRNELPPEAGYGPPYGLLQGTLEGLRDTPPREDTVVAKKGHVCMIPGTKEFFIAANDHDEWGSAHTVWGMVQNMTTVTSLLRRPFHTVTHPTYGTVMRMMNTDVSFAISGLRPGSHDQ